MLGEWILAHGVIKGGWWSGVRGGGAATIIHGIFESIFLDS